MKRAPMEPFDIDNIVREKLQESNDLHTHEMESAKPFVWSAVQNQIGWRRSLTWVHLAAAVVLLMIGFSFILFSVQKGHKKEIELLSEKIDQMQTYYVSQEKQLRSKDTQVAFLGNELKNVKIQLADMQHMEPLTQKETIVYRTDTVYLKQVEYITAVSDPTEAKEITIGTVAEQPEQVETAKVQERETDDVIFPSYSNQGNRPPSETIKFKFGPFVARKN